MLTKPHHSAKALDFSRRRLDFDAHKDRIQKFFGELGFDVKTRLWGGLAEHSITVVHRRKESNEETDFGFTELEKAIYVVCVVLKEQQGSSITEDLLIEHLARKKDENLRLVINKKDIGPTLARLEDRGILIKVREKEYDKGWNWDVFFDPATILSILEKSIEYDLRNRPQIQSKTSNIKEGNTNETETD
jgi:hypothetical protein